MKFEINFDHMPDYVLIQTDGEASPHDFDSLLTALVHSPEWKTGTSQIVDHRKLLLDHLLLEDMQKIESIVKKYSETLGDGYCAFIVKDALGFGTARMYELIGGENIHHGIRVFYTINEAVDWLKKQKQFNKGTE